MDASSISFMFKLESSFTVITQHTNQNKKELSSLLWVLQINPVDFLVQVSEMDSAAL